MILIIYDLVNLCLGSHFQLIDSHRRDKIITPLPTLSYHRSHTSAWLWRNILSCPSWWLSVYCCETDWERCRRLPYWLSLRSSGAWAAHQVRAFNFNLIVSLSCWIADTGGMLHERCDSPLLPNLQSYSSLRKNCSAGSCWCSLAYCSFY